jgi:hypothetical protein
MQLKPEVIRSLQREQKLSEVALARLTEQCQTLETRYGWATEEFLHKFNSGEIGDDQDFFRWYALAQATADWQATRQSLSEVLTQAEYA